jgi:tetratricopeptide (TPR) repeat protein
MSDTANADLARAEALRNLGEKQRSQSGSDGGIAAYQEAIAIMRQQSVPLRLAHTIRHLGDIYRHAGDFDQAARCYDEALTIYRDQPDARPLDLANALRGAALLKERTGDAQHAIKFWEEAKNLYAAENVETGAAEGARRLERLRESKHE